MAKQKKTVKCNNIDRVLKNIGGKKVLKNKLLYLCFSDVQFVGPKPM